MISVGEGTAVADGFGVREAVGGIGVSVNVGGTRVSVAGASVGVGIGEQPATIRIRIADRNNLEFMACSLIEF